VTYTTIPRAVQLGRCGELIAEAVFEENCYKCCRVNHEGFDLIIFDDDGDHYRVEVKAASGSSGISNPRYKFMTSKGSSSKKMYTTDDTDLIVFVALDLRRIVVRCVTSLEHKRTTVLGSEFLDCEDAQIRKAIAEVKKRR